MSFPPLVLKNSKLQALMREHPGHPALQKSTVETFSSMGRRMRADVITGPAKLYRVIDPSNEAAGTFWISEATFKAIKDRDAWRSRFAVKPEWNQNGWFVEYELKAGEKLPVWRGTAASQELTGTNRYLEGGGEQIVFYPGSRDKMIKTMPRIDRDTGNPVYIDRAGNTDNRVEFIDLAGEIAPAKLRARILDPHIKGPFETGWGATDCSPQEAKRILLTAPSHQ